MKNATAVRNPLDRIALPILSRYKVQLDPGDPGNGNLATDGVEGLERSRDEAREDVVDGITFSSSFASSYACLGISTPA